MRWMYVCTFVIMFCRANPFKVFRSIMSAEMEGGWQERGGREEGKGGEGRGGRKGGGEGSMASN